MGETVGKQNRDALFQSTRMVISMQQQIELRFNNRRYVIQQLGDVSFTTEEATQSLVVMVSQCSGACDLAMIDDAGDGVF